MQETVRSGVAVRSVVILGLAVGFFGCLPAGSTGDAGPDGDGGVTRVVPVPGCTGVSEAPIRNGQGGYSCTRVGADNAAVTVEWPDTTGVTGTILYVRAGAMAPGMGTMAAPYPTVAAALAAAMPGTTIAVARGNYAWTSTLAITANVSIRGAGAGPGGTAFDFNASTDAITVSGAMTTDVTLAGFLLRRQPMGAPMLSGVHVTAGARVTARNLVIEGATNGFEIDAAQLAATDVTVTASATTGMSFSGGATGTAEGFLIQTGVRYGIVSRNSRVELRRGLVTRNTRDGIALIGAPTAGGMPNVIDRVVSLLNGVTGMRFEQRVRVDLTLVTIAGTMVPSGTVGGDGVYVGSGAVSVLDNGFMPAARGGGSASVANARTGALVDGDMSSFAASGTQLGSNEGPGLFAQQRASVPTLAHASVLDNGALGVGIASGASIVSVLDNGFHTTRTADLQTTTQTLRLGDGISITENASTMADISGNEFAGNGRFAAIFAGGSARLQNNTGTGNGFGVFVDSTSTVMQDPSNNISGVAAVPSTLPATARGQIQVMGAM